MAPIWRRIAVYLGVGTLLAGAMVGCGGDSVPQIDAEDVWARPSMAMPATNEQAVAMGDEQGGTSEEVNSDPATGATGAVFMKLVNRGGQADQLVSAESDVASMVELHRTTMADGVMKMSPVESIEIPGNGEVVLKPGDYHIMLLGLKRDLNAGDELDVKLNFEKSQPLSLKVVVQEM